MAWECGNAENGHVVTAWTVIDQRCAYLQDRSKCNTAGRDQRAKQTGGVVHKASKLERKSKTVQ